MTLAASGAEILVGVYANDVAQDLLSVWRKPHHGHLSPEEVLCIKTVNYITLADMLRYGSNKVSCFDLYRTYFSMPFFIHKDSALHGGRQAGPASLKPKFRQPASGGVCFNQPLAVCASLKPKF
jgi:hypothetical protein